MSRITKALFITAVAVMLVAATSAYGYHEVWDGWFNSGELTYLEATFDYVEGEGMLRDTTAGSVDSFLVPIITPSTFTCAATGYYIKLWPDASGRKPTGQSEQKQAYDGGWTGEAILYRPPLPDDLGFDVEGTWWSTYPNFNYNTEPDSYTAWWRVSYSTPVGLGGTGGSSGTLRE